MKRYIILLALLQQTIKECIKPYL